MRGGAALLLVLFMCCNAMAASVEPTDLMGEYSLGSFTVSNQYGTYTSSDFSNLTGRASMTLRGMVLDMSGYNSTLGHVEFYSCGFYTLSSYSDTMNVSIKGGDSIQVSFNLSDEVFSAQWSQYIDGVSSDISCQWNRTQHYYTSQTNPDAVTKVVVVPLN